MAFPPFSLSFPIWDWIQAFFLKLGLFGSILVPAMMTAVGVVLYFALSNVRTTRKLVKPTNAKDGNQDVEGMTLQGLSQKQLEILEAMAERREKKSVPVTGDGNGASDLEDRLIGALASAPWEVKDGSEIALEKNDKNKWGIATKKIAFVLGRNGDAKTVPPTISPPEEPQPPAPMEEEEVSEEAIQ